MKVKFKRLSEDVKLPKYMTKGSSGMDFYAYYGAWVPPGETVKIESGLEVELPEGYGMEVKGRSGLSLNQNYHIKTGVIDSDYRGEIGFIISNPSNENLFIARGERIAQGIIYRIEQASIEEVDELTDTDRGTGGFGHTGK